MPKDLQRSRMIRETVSVEYAYADTITITSNEKQDNGNFKTSFVIDYDLKDIDRNTLGGKTLEHSNESATKYTVNEITDMLKAHIRSDKLELSGYEG